MSQQLMKYIASILAFALISTATAAEPQTTTQEQFLTELVEVGIDAGINACIIRGMPRNKLSLEIAKAHAKALVQALYMETKWQWKNPQPIDPQAVGKPEGEQAF